MLCELAEKKLQKHFLHETSLCIKGSFEKMIWLKKGFGGPGILLHVQSEAYNKR